MADPQHTDDLVRWKNAAMDELARRRDLGSKLAAAQEEIARLAREKASAERRADELDCCMCGSPMSAHDMGSGHAPVSMYDYHLNQAQERATRAEQEAAQLREVRDVLTEIVDYRGGAETAIDDQYLMERAHEALASAAGTEG